MLIGDAGLTLHRSRLLRVECEEDEWKCQCAAHAAILSSGCLRGKAAVGLAAGGALRL